MTSTRPAVQVVPPAQNAAVGPGQLGVGWALGDPVRDLDANLIRLGPGARIGEHTEPVLGVLLVVVAGTGELRTPDTTWVLEAGSVVWMPVGATRALCAGADGMTYATAHRRRPPLGIGPAPRAGADGAAALPDPVCAACGRPATERDARHCAGCGRRLPH
ncbi:hypothetical protein [Streptomyces subrutilus]|uniref:Cupin domain-containing protein n=1 Tax=Streptomyces subrutilus TaxID=36818 RepID=A0A5P2UKQ7_9ACTN|nr:hypothetical protein [Streptomyces subrutilus]QEU77207.1 hypothetical protein CP968_01885 [Streptomyces subrutilus]WSJ33816.1 hypothetical protein OG479_33355 [Streptomyces subrutilus]GGZ45534.1 hypothetical protein GCM10010371_00630 [Streptomyces subrutilus]